MAETNNYNLIPNHPLVPERGVFADDPTWDSYQQNIKEYRERVDRIERNSSVPRWRKILNRIAWWIRSL